MKLVTLAQARAHLRSDTDADDDDLLLKITAASAAVVRYLGDYEFCDFDSAGMIVDSAGDPINVQPRVQQATLMMVGYLYKERDGSNAFAVPERFGYGYLPLGVTALLYGLRRPVVI